MLSPSPGLCHRGRPSHGDRCHAGPSPGEPGLGEAPGARPPCWNVRVLTRALAAAVAACAAADRRPRACCRVLMRCRFTGHRGQPGRPGGQGRRIAAPTRSQCLGRAPGRGLWGTASLQRRLCERDSPSGVHSTKRTAGSCAVLLALAPSPGRGLAWWREARPGGRPTRPGSTLPAADDVP